MALDLSLPPYHDDFDEKKKFLRVLFTPTGAVQTRELNQLQSILQNQIERFGRHIFEDGARVKDGEITFDTKYPYVKLEANVDLNTSIKRDFLVGRVFVGQTSNVRAEIVQHIDDEGQVVFYVKYLSGGQKTFLSGENLLVEGTATTYRTVALNAVGVGSAATIKAGYYFIKGKFSLVDGQVLILEPYSDKPSYKVGLKIVESIVTAQDDSSLYDNANGSDSFSAPGADRLKVELQLHKLAIEPKDSKFLATTTNTATFPVNSSNVRDAYVGSIVTITGGIGAGQSRKVISYDGTTRVAIFDAPWEADSNGRYPDVTSIFNVSWDETDFKELLRLRDGEAFKQVEYTDYSEIEKTLARRTFDESGDYTVRAWRISAVDNVDDPDNIDLELEPGKGYVRGFEIQTINKTIVKLPRARRDPQDILYRTDSTVLTPLGNYVDVDIASLFDFPDVTTHDVCALCTQHPANLAAVDNTFLTNNRIGSCRVRAIQRIGSTTVRFHLFDIRMNAGKIFEHARCIVGFVPGTSTVRSAAIVTPDRLTLQGTVKINANGSGITSTMTGYNTRFVTDDSLPLNVGDWVLVSGTRYEITAIASDSSASVKNVEPGATTVTATDNAQITVLYSEPKLPQQNLMVYPLAYKGIRNTKNQDGKYNNIYTVFREFFQNSDGSGNITLSTGGESSVFISQTPEDYLVVRDSTNAAVTSGLTFTLSLSKNQVTISGLANSVNYRIIAKIRKTAGSDASTGASIPKTKTSTDATFTSFASVKDLRTVSLGKCDVYKIVKITTLADTNYTNAPDADDLDITDYYTLDDGQRDSHYDVSRLILKPGFPNPPGRIFVQFKYFVHGNNGNHFSVDSYLPNQTGGIPYEEIPSYTSPTTGEIYALSDCLDFRPRIDVNGNSFIGTEASLTEVPLNDATIDFSLYLNRIDKLYVDPKGDFRLIYGVPDLFPVAPNDPDDGMLLYTISVRAYTKTKADVFFTFHENKRYTMRDIGSLEKRIANAEKYITLSLLEKSTSDLEIRDADGLDRLKGGFIVDPFNGHGIGDVQHPDYKCSIDMKAGVLRPPFISKNVNLILDPSVNPRTNNFQITGDLITLPYEHYQFLDQPLATGSLNINPYAVFNFLGSLSLNPSQDEWKDTERAPDLVINNDGNYDAIAKMAEDVGVIWNEWEDSWTGQPVTSTSQDISVNRGWRRPGTPRVIPASGRGKNRVPERIIPPVHPEPWPVQNVTLTRTTTTIETGQTRSGRSFNVQPETVTETIGENVLDVSFIPFMRRRVLTATVSAMKPSTDLYVYFDGTDVTKYCRKIGYKQTLSASWNGEWTNGGTDLRTVFTYTPTNFTLFDGVMRTGYRVQYGKSVGTVVEIISSNTFRVEFEKGPISDQPGPGNIDVWIPATHTQGKITTDNTGKASFEFEIPTLDVEGVQFKTGERIMRVTDSPSDDKARFTTLATTSYHAQGLLERKQSVVLSTKQAIVTTENHADNRVITNSTTDTKLEFGPWIDPLAQSFQVTVKGGIYLTQVDVFLETKDSNIPLTCQIRPMRDGSPMEVTVPGGEMVMDAVNVNINEINAQNKLVINGVVTDLEPTSRNFKPTRFTFKEPLYLLENVSYCVVLLANSTKYNAWIATGGQKLAGSEIPLTEQAYAGVLFKSSNGSTWTEDQNSDMMFKLYRAEFNTAVQGDVVFVNDSLTPRLLPVNPLETYFASGALAADLKKVMVHHPNHGMIRGCRVTLSNCLGFNGIPSGDLNKTHTITWADQHRYIVSVDTSATSRGFGGGSNCRATENVQLDTGNVICSDIILPDTNIDYSIRFSSPFETGFHPNVLSQPTFPISLDTTYDVIDVNKNFEFFDSKVICSPVNETSSVLAINGAGVNSKSLFFRANLASSVSNLSPVIDISRLSLIAVSNIVNSPVAIGSGSTNVFPHDHYLLRDFESGVTYDSGGKYLYTTSATSAADLARASVGKTIEIQLRDTVTTVVYTTNAIVTEIEYNNGSLISDATNRIKVYLDRDVTLPPNSYTIKVTLFNNVVSGLAPQGSSCEAIYITRKINLETPCTGLNVRMGTMRPDPTDVELYYKTLPVGSQANFDDLPWKKATLFKDPGKSMSENDFVELEFPIDGLVSFQSCAFKVQLLSTERHVVPMVTDFQGITLVV